MGADRPRSISPSPALSASFWPVMAFDTHSAVHCESTHSPTLPRGARADHYHAVATVGRPLPWLQPDDGRSQVLPSARLQDARPPRGWSRHPHGGMHDGAIGPRYLQRRRSRHCPGQRRCYLQQARIRGLVRQLHFLLPRRRLLDGEHLKSASSSTRLLATIEVRSLTFPYTFPTSPSSSFFKNGRKGSVLRPAVSPGISSSDVLSACTMVRILERYEVF